MMLNRWISRAASSGWRFERASGQMLTLRCSKQGCEGRHVVSLLDLGDPPPPCKEAHVGQYSRATYGDYRALVAKLRDRRRALSLSQEDVGDAAGLGDGHINKLEAFHRTAQMPTLQLWAQTLGLSIDLVPAPLPDATRRAIEGRAARPYDAGKAQFRHDGEQ